MIDARTPDRPALRRIGLWIALFSTVVAIPVLTGCGEAGGTSGGAAADQPVPISVGQEVRTAQIRIGGVEVTAEIARADLQGILRAFLWVVSPRMFLSTAPRIWATYANFTKIEIVEKGLKPNMPNRPEVKNNGAPTRPQTDSHRGTSFERYNK